MRLSKGDAVPISLREPPRDGSPVLMLLNEDMGDTWVVGQWWKRMHNDEYVWMVEDFDGCDAHYSVYYKDEHIAGFILLEK